MSTELTLKLVAEHKIHTLLPGCHAEARLEASGVLYHAGQFFVVFDNRMEVARLPDELRPPDHHNSLLGVARYEEGYEGITYNPRKSRFYLLIESSRTADKCRAVVVEAVQSAEGLKIVKERPLDFVFESGNKGFEALANIAQGDHDYVLALCEGNKCKGGAAGRKPGGGRIQVFKKAKRKWKRAPGNHGQIKLPKAVQFTDYSAMSVDLERRRFAIVSQENSALWVGVFDQEKWQWEDDGTIYHFPRTDAGEILYGNVEGVAWVSADRVAVVSDKRKSDQPEHVKEKDQSIHLFDLPSP